MKKKKLNFQDSRQKMVQCTKDEIKIPGDAQKDF